MALSLVVAGCVAPGQMPYPPLPEAGSQPSANLPAANLPVPSRDFANSPQESARGFAEVIRKMEPAVERECVQRRTQPINCDFQFVVDDRAGLEPNAFQTVDSTGRPIIGFTISLIAEARNADELAFVVGHEASHHILGHINRKSTAASAGRSFWAVWPAPMAAADRRSARRRTSARRWARGTIRAIGSSRRTTSGRSSH
ncbi:M48 family metalloprotease [Paracoccus cavernae]|uniref:M48 family metalloprotease n=1 Tax=Paracoccus cavernae TaxID=1571207 RepID=A0ABT8D299_9RHOB|nr:M48 family metalloprotease [Paracoccus cavernae]